VAESARENAVAGRRREAAREQLIQDCAKTKIDAGKA
jgi:hypothetical protein